MYAGDTLFARAFVRFVVVWLVTYLVYNTQHVAACVYMTWAKQLIIAVISRRKTNLLLFNFADAVDFKPI